MRKPKPKKCKVCHSQYQPRNSLQTTCGMDCALRFVRAEAERKEAKEIKAKRASLKTRSELAREAQSAFNAWVRERDKDLPCISCGRFHDGQWHAGHYRTVGGNPELRFEPLNVHKQCAPCNNHKSGDIVNYRISLEKRIGAEALAWLEGNHEPKKYTREDLIEIKKHYRALTRSLIRAAEDAYA